MNLSSSLTRAALCVASGLALALAFPKVDFSLFAWVAFIPLFYEIGRASCRERVLRLV